MKVGIIGAGMWPATTPLAKQIVASLIDDMGFDPALSA